MATSIEEAAIDVAGEAALLQRLFFILIDNAIKYTPENGAVKVSLRSTGEFALIDIGTGLGLSIANGLLERVAAL